VAHPGGATNYSYETRVDERAILEVQVRDSAMVGAGLMLVGARPASSAEREKLTAFARGVVGECPTAGRLIAKRYATAVSQIDEAPAATCGPWQVRAGKVGHDYQVSLDRQ